MKPTIIYMNDLVRCLENRRLKVPEPVIAVYRDGKLTYSNHVNIVDNNFNTIATIRFSGDGLKAPVPHNVHAWIEVGAEGFVEVE